MLFKALNFSRQGHPLPFICLITLTCSQCQVYIIFPRHNLGGHARLETRDGEKGYRRRRGGGEKPQTITHWRIGGRMREWSMLLRLSFKVLLEHFAPDANASHKISCLHLLCVTTKRPFSCSDVFHIKCNLHAEKRH